MSAPDPASVLEWEAAGRRIEVDGREVFVRDVPAAGDESGPPVLVLHGFPSASFDYRHVLDALRRTRRVILFDFLGFGLSAKPDLRYSIELQADVTEAVVAACGIDRVVLLTHDMGDTVGGEVLARDLDGTLGFSIERRALTNGSIYIEMAQLSTGQQLLLSLPDERNELVGADEGAAFRGGLAGTFAEARQPDDEELDAQWALMRRHQGSALLPRTIRYIEDRRDREAPLHRRHRVPPVAARGRVGPPRPDRGARDDRPPAGRPARHRPRHPRRRRPLPDDRGARAVRRGGAPRAGRGLETVSMRAVVVYESLTGNTAKAARLIAEQLTARGITTAAYPVNKPDYQVLSEADLVVVGGWTDGIVIAGQKPGRSWRLKKMPAISGKKAVVFATYAIDPGKVLEKLVTIVEGRGAEVLGGMTIRRDRLEESTAEFVDRIVEVLEPA